MTNPMPPEESLRVLREGTVIPASPLALDGQRKWDKRHQAAVYRYYAAAGSGGIAVGVHTTQFEIRDPEHGLFEPLLRFAAEEIDGLSKHHGRRIVRIAGVCGRTEQATGEAALASELGYDAVLLSLAALGGVPEQDVLAHCKAVAERAPVVGFYLQPSVGGRHLSYDFWRRFADIPNVVAIKAAPFDRYRTIDVLRAVAESGRAGEISMYTGNDDNIIADLLSPFEFETSDGTKRVDIVGGLLGQWSVWTYSFVNLLSRIHCAKAADSIPPGLLIRNGQLTDANAAVFDAANAFAGCIPGINEVLRRQGLLPSANCLDPALCLSPGQAEELDRVQRAYPWLPDDEFVKAHLAQWLS